MINLNETITTNENTLLIYKANINFEIKKFISEFIIKNNNVYFNYCTRTNSDKNTNHFKKLAKLDFFNNDFTPFINFIDINFFDFITRNDVIEYTKTKDKLIKKLSSIILDKYKSKFWEIFQNYEVYKIEYDKIKNDRKHYFHKMLAIKKAVEIENAKTINVTIKKDNEPFSFKTTSREFLRFEPYHNELFFKNNDDKINYNRLFGHENYHITDILRITYRGKEIYNKNNMI